MYEYLESKRKEQVDKYERLIYATGMFYPDLYELHTKAVAAHDRRHEDEKAVPVVLVNAGVLAYLTDLALQELALGAVHR